MVVLKVVICLFPIFSIHGGPFVHGELSTEITPEENQALTKLKPLVIKQLYKPYMKDDHYLVRFLRARNRDVNAAMDMLLQSLNWRKQWKMDTILEEQLEIEKILPYLITRDKVGRPVGMLRAGDFPVRKILIAGRYAEIIRFIYKILEVAMEEIRKAAAVTGKNFTQGQMIGDLSGFSAREHACLLCLRLYVDLIGTYEKNYPQIANNFFSVNTPRIFESVWSIIKPVLSDYTRNSVSVYGYDRNEWRKALLAVIPDDQLPGYLGGSYIDTSHHHQS